MGEVPGSIPTGGEILSGNFLFSLGNSLVPVLAVLCVSENPDCQTSITWNSGLLGTPSGWHFCCSQTKLRKGNVFTPVCQPFCSRGGGGCLPHYMLGYTPPSAGTFSQAGTPPRQVYPPAGTPPRAGTLSKAGTPPGQVHHPGQVHPPGRYTPLGQIHPPTTVTAADGTHPTGMLPCFTNIYLTTYRLCLSH